MTKKYLLILFALLSISGLLSLAAQSNPKMDRPIQQCINNHSQELEKLSSTFSIGYWLGRFVETCENLQASTGKGGGPQVVSLLAMEAELDELILLADKGCEDLADEKVKTLLQEMKTIYQEKQDVETFDRGQNDDSDNLFAEEDEITTMSISRGSAGKLKSKAAKIKKILEK
jgi:hypothetical protein